MKRYTIYSISAAFVLAGALTACQRAEFVPQESGPVSGEGVRLTAFAEAPQGTRTAISSDTGADASVSWTVGDAAKVYYDGGSTTATVDGVSASGYDAANLSATFVTADAIPTAVTDLYAVYPASATSSLSGSTLSVTIPAVQDGTFKGANYMVAKTTREEATLSFRHLVSYLEIKVGSASVTRIVIAGENGEGLVGTLPVTFDAEGIPQAGTASSTAAAITLTVAGAGNYYAALLPGLSLSKGLSMRFYDSDGNILNSYCHQNALTTVRGTIHYFTDASGIDGRSRYLYATVSGAGDKDGSSWANAMDKAGLYAFLNDGQLQKDGVLTALTEEQRNALSGVTLRLGAGTYAMGARTTLTGLATAEGMEVNIVGGYPAAGGLTPDPVSNETILSGASSYQILFAYPASSDSLALSLTGLTVSGSNAARGGAAALEFHGAKMGVRMNDCVIKDNVNGYSIGGIQLADGVYAEIADCTFSGNQATQGAAAGLDGTGTEVTFTRCVFSGNQASLKGGAVKFSESAADAKLTCIGCDFTGNTAADWGGAFYCNAPATAVASFTGCTFGDASDATKKNAVTNYGGGAVYLGEGGAAHTVRFADCDFYDNSALAGGGAIHVSNALNASSATCVSNLSLSGCTFRGNHVVQGDTNAPKGGGGAVDFRSSGALTISGCTFKQNYTTHCTATFGYLASGGAVCVSDGNLGDSTPATVHISETVFEGNHTGTTRVTTYHMNCGGALAVICGNDGTADRKSYANVYIDKCSFLDNYANQGGALFLGGNSAAGIGGTTFLNDCLFDGNYILHQYGTTINTYFGGTLCINNTTFHNTWTAHSATGQWRCWVNVNQTHFLLSNSTLIGQTQGSSGDTADDTGTNPSLIRFDTGNYNTTYWAAFENNLIVNTKATDASSAYYSIINNTSAKLTRDNNSPHSGFRPFMSNKITHVCQGGSGFDTNYPSSKGASFTNGAYVSTFTDLTWNAGSPRSYQNCYWSWSACTANDKKAGLTNVTNDVTNDCPEFGAWLNTAGIDGFTKDQRGTARPSSVKAGSAE